MKTSKPKARRMWANYYDPLPILYSDKESARFCSSGYGIQHAVVPVAVIPLDGVDTLIEKAATAIARECGYGSEHTPRFWDAAECALVAIGVLPRAKKGRK